MRRTLLAISIGPVQEFIAASRKARDLWRGSSLLGDICWAAAHALQSHGHADAGDAVQMIFPTEKAIAKRAAIANKMLVRIEGDAARAEALAGTAREAAQRALDDEWRAVWRGVSSLGSWLDESLAEAQIGEFLEFYAAWWPIDDTADGYARAREEVERLLAGRKALRDFNQPTGRPGRAKSSLDPARESIIKRRTPVDAYRDVQSRLHLRGAEQLDAISVIKRLSSKRRLISTSRIAIDPFLRRIVPERRSEITALCDLARTLEHTDLVERFPVDAQNGLGHFSTFPFDSQLFYGLPREAKADPGPTQSLLNEADRNAAEEFVRRAERLGREAGVRTFPTSYAILVADGDNMGAALNEIKDASHHITFSDRLTEFATSADGIVQAHYGALLYSGGDDVVAFVPTDTAIPCAEALHDAFAGLMHEARNATGISTLPTLSVGVAIVHFREHLQVAMGWARDAEKAAKGYPGKDALAVHLHTHSGGPNALKVAHAWTGHPVKTRWGRWLRLHVLDAIPDAAAFHLRTLQRELMALGLSQDLLASVLPAEVRRVLERKRGQRGSESIPKEQLDALVALIGSDLGQLSRVVDELLIARRLATSVDIAGKTALDHWQRYISVDDLRGRTPR